MVEDRRLRIVFFGTPAFAVPTLDALLGSRHQVVAVVTQPDKPRGRGQKTSDAPVKARALAAAILVLQPRTLKDPAFMTAFTALNADIGVVAAYGKILSDAVLAVPRLGLVNVHASLLPRHRGAAPVHRAIIAGDSVTGVTIMKVVKALDAGPMMAEVARPIEPNETSEEVERDLSVLGARLLVSTLNAIADGSARETPQDDNAATYAARLTKEDGLIRWDSSAQRIHDLIRGLHPWPHAYTFLEGSRLILLRSLVPSEPSSGMSGMPGVPGTVAVAQGDQLRITTGSGALDIIQIQAEGKRPMTAREFLAGHRLQPGRRFTSTP
jgi:methionyl-tRNA formyltransferase